MVVPQPTSVMPVSYAVARANKDLLNTVNTWLMSEKSRGFIDERYRYWMLGEGSKEARAPRWSVARDILGWGQGAQ